MSGTLAMLPKSKETLKTVKITPELATSLLERNGLNRPLNDQHVRRIADQIRSGKWRFNGDTIKIADTNDVLDGQHRLWAIIEARTAVETILVTGIAREAFATIDTLRRPRSGADVLALNGAHLHRNAIAGALTWLMRWQRGIIPNYRAPKNRIENSDIEDMFRSHGGIALAAERTVRSRRIANPSLLTFFYYVLVNRNPDLAERMMRTLEYPQAVSIDDPFFCLRTHFINNREVARDPVVTIALMIKAANAAFKNRKLKTLAWRNQGENPEQFPTLQVEGEP